MIIELQIALLAITLLTLVGFGLKILANSSSLSKGHDEKLAGISSGQERVERSIRDDLRAVRSDSNHSSKQLREEVNGSIKSFGETLSRTFTDLSGTQKNQLELFSGQISSLTEVTQKSISEMRRAVDEQLKSIQRDNNSKLDQMRMTVDEKLQGTLEKRLTESFKIVSDRLEMVHKGLGEMHTLTTGVGDLKRILTNVKTRGTWGEYQLANILEQTLTQDQYDTNVAVKPRSQERVEFAVKMPGHEDNDDSFIYLPIDSKFPQEDYQRLVTAQEEGEPELAKSASDALELSIRREAKRIKDKYISEKTTTPFAVLFLPTEGLYSEVLRRPGLADRLQRDYRVLVAGPTTLTALLNSLQMGFRTLAIQKRSSEIWKHLSVVKSQFTGFSNILENVQKKLESASKEVDKATKKSKTIEKKLEKFEELPASTAEQLTGLQEA